MTFSRYDRDILNKRCLKIYFKVTNLEMAFYFKTDRFIKKHVERLKKVFFPYLEETGLTYLKNQAAVFMFNINNFVICIEICNLILYFSKFFCRFDPSFIFVMIPSTSIFNIISHFLSVRFE